MSEQCVRSMEQLPWHVHAPRPTDAPATDSEIVQSGSPLTFSYLQLVAALVDFTYAVVTAAKNSRFITPTKNLHDGN